MENKTNIRIPNLPGWPGILVLCTVFIGFYACNDLNMDGSRGEGTINFYLSNTPVDSEKGTVVSSETGEPAENHHNRPQNLQEVNIDVQQIRIFYKEVRTDTVSTDSITYSEGEEGEWFDVSFEPAVWNLLDIADNDTLITSADLPEGYYSEIRLILGNNNTVVTEEGDVHNLKVPSGRQSGYKIKFDSQLNSGQTFALTIEFDAEQSIHVTGNGQYMLRPVLNIRGGND